MKSGTLLCMDRRTGNPRTCYLLSVLFHSTRICIFYTVSWEKWGKGTSVCILWTLKIFEIKLIYVKANLKLNLFPHPCTFALAPHTHAHHMAFFINILFNLKEGR